MAKLLILSGQESGIIHQLGSDQVLGRSVKNGIPLKDTRASREHARISTDGSEWWIEDLESKNGTRVNGAAVTRSRLSPGDEVVIGDTWMRFEEDDSGLPLPDSLSEATIEVRNRPGQVSDRALRTAGSRQRSSHPTRTSLSWLRDDLAQSGGMFRLLIYLGVVVLAGGLAYLGFRLTSGS
jgi:hypothetical protein